MLELFNVYGALGYILSKSSIFKPVQANNNNDENNNNNTNNNNNYSNRVISIR